MPGKPKILIDINIILDVLQKREPFYKTSVRLLALVETGQVQGYLAAHSLTTLFSLIRKDKSAADARATLTNLLQFNRVAPVDQTTIEQALNLDYRDYEDAVQMISALQIKADHLITHNIRDYQPALLSVLQPIDFLATIFKMRTR
jgi:predicted nucleic acid-binding protein